MAHHTDSSGNTYVDTDFINSVRAVGATVGHMGFGEFYADTPKGRVEFDRMRGRDFPGQSGRSHKLYGDRGAAEWLVKEMERKGHSDRVASMRVASWADFNTSLAKLMRGLKRDLGAKKVKQHSRNSRGHRNIWVSLPDVTLDVWLDDGHAQLGRLLWKAQGWGPTIQYGNSTPEQV